MKLRLKAKTTSKSQKERWKENYDKVRDFVSAQGRFPTELDNETLNNWVLNQRRLHSEGCLLAYRKSQLERIPEWSWTPQVDEWTQNFKKVRNFKNSYGHLPTRAEDEVLGEWVITQRNNPDLLGERRSRLISIDSDFFK